MHRHFCLIFLLQSTMALSFLAAPIFLILSVLLGFTNNEFIICTVGVVFLCTGLHAFANNLVILIATKPYRMAIYQFVHRTYLRLRPWADHTPVTVKPVKWQAALRVMHKWPGPLHMFQKTGPASDERPAVE
ncbi:unnamed protein product, partial [Mesorhabditis spiculigera]